MKIKKQYLNKKTSIFVTLILLMLMSLTVVSASDRPIIDEYQKENTYVLAQEKDIDATINGDLFLITRESNIQGTINKDLNAISAKIKIQGVIGDDLRLIAGEANINAYVFGELKIISDNLVIRNTSIINGKTSIKATNAEIKGTFNEEVKIDANKLELNAVIKGDAVLKGKNILVHPETRIHGDLVLPKGATVPENVVLGEIIFKEEEPRVISTRELLVGKITLFLIITILAGFLHLVANARTNKLVKNSTKKSIMSLLIGILGVIILPILAIISLFTIITAPIGALLLLALLAILIITPALGVLLIGKKILEMIRPQEEIRLEIIIGALVVVALSFIPGFLGIMLFLLYALFLGTIIRGLFLKRKRKQKIKAKNKVTKTSTKAKKKKKK